MEISTQEQEIVGVEISRLRLEILADLSHGHAQVSPVDPSCPVPHLRLKIED